MSAAGLALLDGCAGWPSAPGVATETLETTTVRLALTYILCQAPLVIAEDMLKAEGFTDVQYIKLNKTNTVDVVVTGAADLGMQFSGPVLNQLEVGSPIVSLAGVHVGCFELFGTDQVRAIPDLKGKTVAIYSVGGPDHVFLASMAAYVGLDASKDIDWVTYPKDEAKQLLTEGKIDALMGFPPVAQELQAKKIGHVVVNSMVDKPWSQYFCCMVVANRGFIQQNPVAAKRALRAILKATDLCAREPERVARTLVERGYTPNYDYALEAMKAIPYNTWREYDPADTLRFYALRLREAGMIKSTPDELIAKGTDWRFLNELKQELPAPAAGLTNSGLLCHIGEPG
jgi:NitT/TauT family transport system substrate-binding protein